MFIGNKAVRFQLTSPRDPELMPDLAKVLGFDPGVPQEMKPEPGDFANVFAVRWDLSQCTIIAEVITIATAREYDTASGTMRNVNHVLDRDGWKVLSFALNDDAEVTPWK